jgi:hypothetical protein
MNYLCKDKETGNLFVITKWSKDFSKYIENKSCVSLGTKSFYVLQEIEVR